MLAGASDKARIVLWLAGSCVQAGVNVVCVVARWGHVLGSQQACQQGWQTGL